MRIITLFTVMLLSLSAAAMHGAPSSNVRGDVNADGEVNISDVNAVVDAILTGGTVTNEMLDVNEDGEINIADVNFIVDIILTGPVAPLAETGMYMGLIGFNQNLYTKELSYLDSTTVTQFNDFVESLSTQNGRLLYYSVDKAIDALVGAQNPENLQNVAVVTFTEGLDQGSLMMTDKYDTESEYAAALHSRIVDQRVYGRAIKAYTVGLMNENVGNESLFRSNLYDLSSDSAKAMEVTSMAEVNTKFQEIADDLSSRNMSETLTLVFPGVGTGTRIRFTLDEVDNQTVNDSQVYIEGTFSLRGRSLSNIEYKGMTCSSGDSVAASSVDGMFVSLVFNGIQLESGEQINKNLIQEWYWIEEDSAWQASTEFSTSNLPEVTSTYSSALVMLVMDCSSTLGENLDDLKSAANSFIERMQNYNTTPGMFTVNGVSFMMVPVEGGTFDMGTPIVGEDSLANAEERPVHPVTVSSYSIGRTEVTQELWHAVMGNNPSSFNDNPQRPVEQVSWDDCQEFISRLNALTGKNFRLPTEAEWEYAARGGNKTKGYVYAGSDDVNEVAWYYGNSYAMGTTSPDYGTHVVGTKDANELGLFDMSGNVFEWCNDWYGAYTLPETDEPGDEPGDDPAPEDEEGGEDGGDDVVEPVVDPTGPEAGTRRVTRGGSWYSTENDTRSSFRTSETPTNRSYSMGLRLAL